MRRPCFQQHLKLSPKQIPTVSFSIKRGAMAAPELLIVCRRYDRGERIAVARQYRNLRQHFIFTVTRESSIHTGKSHAMHSCRKGSVRGGHSLSRVGQHIGCKRELSPLIRFRYISRAFVSGISFRTYQPTYQACVDIGLSVPKMRGNLAALFRISCVHLSGKLHRRFHTKALSTFVERF